MVYDSPLDPISSFLPILILIVVVAGAIALFSRSQWVSNMKDRYKQQQEAELETSEEEDSQSYKPLANDTSKFDFSIYKRED